MLYRRDVLKSLAALVCALLGFAGKPRSIEAKKPARPDGGIDSWMNGCNWAGGAMPRPTTTIKVL